MLIRLAFASLMLAMACSDSPTEAAGGSGGAAGSGGSGGEPIIEVGETCVAFCATVVVECSAFPLDEPTCQQFCQQDLNAEYQHAAACGAAAEAVFECAAGLDCEQVDAWIAQSPPDAFPCQTEVSVFDALVSARICLPPG